MNEPFTDRTWSLTNLDSKDTLYLEIEKSTNSWVRYEVTQITASWACNEIPQAQVMIAVGRNARNGVDVATAHKAGVDPLSMQKARVWFQPSGDYTPNGFQWPDEPVIVFEGYFVGGSHRKVNGKAVLVYNLTHWLIDLACSSAISQNSHPSNPQKLTEKAILRQVGLAGSGKGAYISNLIGYEVVKSDVKSDFWSGLKKLFCGIANIPVQAAGPSTFCKSENGVGSFTKNTRALSALRRIEGPVSGAIGDTTTSFGLAAGPVASLLAKGGNSCTLGYTYGVPLSMNTIGVDLVVDAVAVSVTDRLLDSYANTTFWDKLVGEYCPSYGLALVPMVSTAVVIADTPAFRSAYWKDIWPDEYDSIDNNSSLERPLRAVGVFGASGSLTGAAEGVINDPSFIGGCYVAGSVSEDDGVIQFVAPPAWLNSLGSVGVNALSRMGLSSDDPIPTATSPLTANADKDSLQYNDVKSKVNGLYVRFAQQVYTSNMLRGRVGAISGKLRFDIAPGSCVLLHARAEQFIKGEDNLAVDRLANVSRVTIVINCDVGQAGTMMQLSHIRTVEENKSPRMSLDQHPLFGKQIHGDGKHGAPLIPSLDGLETRS